MQNKWTSWIIIILFYITLLFLGRLSLHLRNYNLFVIDMFCLSFIVIILLFLLNKKAKREE